MTSPASYAPDMDASQSPANPFVDIPTRPMRVKVLYTFDNDNKTNCLARFPDVLNVPTVPIDETTQIGVIELRTCIRAIVSASPELISRLGQGDFTIYAYDYSEYETPLVGQGMLSSALAAQSPTPTAPAYQSKTMITGRVCKNIMGLFSNGVKETLEVKLRLVPVPKPVQNDFIKSMELYRNISPAMSAGFDPNAWSASLQQSGLALGAPFQETPTNTPGRHDVHEHDMAPMQRPRQGSDASFNNGHQSFTAPTPTYSAPPSRANSPIPIQTGPQPYPFENTARPSSRMSTCSDAQNGRRGSFAASESYQDEGPARKRVKVTQADWRGKSAFGMNPDSLRVTASTAASIRVHKPVPTRPGMPGNSLEPPPRVPTPVPQMPLPGGRPNLGTFFRRESSLARAQAYTSPYDQPKMFPPPPSDTALSSPEDVNEDQVDATPTEFPSSPPVLPEPSSPLPFFPRPADSGYMSSTIECHDDDEDRSVDEEDMRTAAQYRPRSQVPPSDVSFIEQTPGPPELLPTKMQMAQQVNIGSKDTAQAELSRQKARNAVIAQGPRRNSLALPPKPQSFNGQGSNKPSMARSASMIVRSDAASPAPSEVAFGLKAPRSGSGAKRKKNIQDQLQRSIENGEMPTFCGHCGAIETPTWRHLFTKVIEGCPDEMDPSESENMTMGTEVLERDPETQKATKYRIIKSMRKTKDSQDSQGFDTLQVCNPCGLWFTKFRSMRPPEKWIKKQNSRKKQQRKVMPPAGPSEPQSDYFVDQPSALYTDAVQPDEDGNESSRERSSEAAQPVNRPRANSVQPRPNKDDKQNQWTSVELDAALHRAIQSSPARFMGTQESPIELETDLTPKPTRRLLFPSPRKAGEVKSLDDMALPGSKPVSSTIIELAFVQEPDKENRRPESDLDDELAHLFECSPNIFKTPRKTPNKTGSPTFDHLLKTPTPSKSSLRTVARNTRTPSGNQGSTFLPTFSPAEAKNLFPMTPSRWANLSSPSRNQMTPLTRQLTQMLSDANYQDFSDLPTFMTPGRNFDFGFDDFSILNADAGPASLGDDADKGDNDPAIAAVAHTTSALHATTSTEAAAKPSDTTSS